MEGWGVTIRGWGGSIQADCGNVYYRHPCDRQAVLIEGYGVAWLEHDNKLAVCRCISYTAKEEALIVIMLAKCQ
jgi:hypothetical protein